MLHLEHSFLWCLKLDTSESRPKIPGKFCNVVLEEDGEDQLYRSCEEWGGITKSQGGQKYRTYNKNKDG